MLLKKRNPNGLIPFIFSELERSSGVDRHHHRKILQKLEEYGLITELQISQAKGHASTFRFPRTLPEADSYNDYTDKLLGCSMYQPLGCENTQRFEELEEVAHDTRQNSQSDKQDSRTLPS